MITQRFATISGALRPRYRIERLVQSGAAACIYVGEDTTLGNRVAVKILHDEMATTVDADRFRAEIGLLAHLRHPHIVPIYDSGEVDGLPYYVMPFIDGETLRARLARLGRLPFAETLRITEDVARALQFAHRHRIVHRDIKPENIIFDRGRALVLDFGIALALDSVEIGRRTLPGLSIGTVHYMSPEQVDAESPIDGRSDIYSLACVVYEMLCGHPPFTGGITTVLRRHLAARPRPLARVFPGACEAIGAVLSRALEKAPDARYVTAGAFLSALQRAAPRVRVIGRRVAVAPFAHANDAPRVDAFSDGVGEEIASALRRFDGIVVAAERPASGEADAHVTHLARDVDGDVLLLGDVRDRADAHVSITASLFDAQSGRRVWQGSSVGPRHSELGGVSEPAERIATTVAAALGIAHRPECFDRAYADGPRVVQRDGYASVSNGRAAAR